MTTGRLGAFLGSDVNGRNRIVGFEDWLGAPVTVGRTYLASQSWADLEGPNWVLNPWSEWVRDEPGRIFALNVPMTSPNEPGQSGAEWQISQRLQNGANGQYNHHFQTLAQRLINRDAADTTLVLGWEMTGFDFGHRAAPNVSAWREFWRQIVATMRGVSGAQFIFCFAPNRGPDRIRWQDCWPGNEWVDEFGLSAYDQPQGSTFTSQRTEPNGLDDAAAWASARGLRLSFPEWGLFRNGDRPSYISGMHGWMADHDVRWHSITDYSPHGIWRFSGNPQSSARYRELFSQTTGGPPDPGEGTFTAGSPLAAFTFPTPSDPADPSDPGGGNVDRFFYDFEDDTVGTTPTGWTVRNGSGISVQSGGVSGAGSRYLRVQAGSGNLDRFISADVANSVADVEIVARCLFTGASLNNEMHHLYMRSNANPSVRSYQGTWSKDPAQQFSVISRYLNGSWTPLRYGNTGNIANGGQWWYLRMRVEGSQLRLRVWSHGTSEPSGWTASTSDSNISSGPYSGVGAWVHDRTYIYDWVGVGLNGQSAPTEPLPIEEPPPPPPPPTSAGLRAVGGTLKLVGATGGGGTVDPIPDGFNSDGVKLTGLSVEVDGQTVTAVMQVETSREVEFSPIVVVCRNQADDNLDFGHQFTTVNGPASWTVSRTLPNGTYAAWVAYSKDDWATGVDLNADDPETFTVSVSEPDPDPPPPGSGGATGSQTPSGYSWNLVFDEQWAQGLRSSIWHHGSWSQQDQFGNRGANNQLEGYTAGQRWVDNGVLVIESVNQPVTINGYTYSWRSGLATTRGSYSFRFGTYVEARCRHDGRRGFWPAFWTWQVDGANSVSEIDVWEHWSGWAQNRYLTTTHGGWGSAGKWNYYAQLPGNASASNWHVYGAHIEQNWVRFYFDGTLVHTINGTAPQQMNLILQQQVPSDDPPSNYGHTSSRVYFDWVRGWSRA